MADRPIWRGQLRLALVTCPISLHTVHKTSSGLHFHFINPDTGNRVKMVTQDAETGDELQRADLKRGFEFEKGRYLVLEENDFDTARVESSSLLAIEKFVPAVEIDPIWYDSSYYVAPDGDARHGNDVYAVLRDAIAATGHVALSRLVINRRERAVVLHPFERGLVLHTLHEARDIADPARVFDAIPSGEPAKDMVDLARQLIERQTGHFKPDDAEDRYENRLREIIDAKAAGAEPAAPAAAPDDDGKVIDLMAALRKSLGQDAPKAKKRTRKAKGAAA
jgi:DNA end-binding protein Ku